MDGIVDYNEDLVLCWSCVGQQGRVQVCHQEKYMERQPAHTEKAHHDNQHLNHLQHKNITIKFGIRK